MKTYLPVLTFEHFLLYGICFFLLGAVLLWLYKRAGFGSSPLRKCLVAGWFLFASLSWVDAFFDFVPHLPDADFYTAAIFDSSFPSDKLEGVQNFYYLSQVMKPLFLGHPEIVGLYSVFFYFLAVLFFQKALSLFQIRRTEPSKTPKALKSSEVPEIPKNSKTSETTNGQRASVALQLFAAFFPAALLYFPLLLREGFLMLGFAMTVYGLLSVYERKPSAFWVLPGLILLCGLRTQNVFFAGGIIVFAAFWLINLPLLRKVVLLFVSGGLGLAALSLAGIGQANMLGDWRNRSVSKESLGEFTYGEVSWENWLDVLVDLPGLVGQFLLSPLPIVDRNVPWETTWIFGDMLLVLALFILSVGLLIRLGKAQSLSVLRSPKVQLWVGIMLIFALMFGFYEYHLSGAVRHRMPFVMMLATLVAYLYSQFLNQTAKPSL